VIPSCQGYRHSEQGDDVQADSVQLLQDKQEFSFNLWCFLHGYEKEKTLMLSIMSDTLLKMGYEI
jgi:hypothetical protein